MLRDTLVPQILVGPKEPSNHNGCTRGEWEERDGPTDHIIEFG